MAQKTLEFESMPDLSQIETVIVDNLEYLNSARNMRLKLNIPITEGFSLIKKENAVDHILNELKRRLRHTNCSRNKFNTSISTSTFDHEFISINIRNKSNRNLLIY
jgi:hypothetical protein